MSDPAAPPSNHEALNTFSANRKKAFNEFQAQSRLRFESLIKLLLLIDGGALTLSIGAALNNSDKLPSRVLVYLESSWMLLFLSIVCAIAVMASMVVATFHMGIAWYKTLGEEPNQVRMIKTWTPLRWFNGILGLTATLCCIIGIGLMAIVAQALLKSPITTTGTHEISMLAPPGFVVSTSPWWMNLASVVLGVILGFGISEIRDWMTKRRSKAQNFEALAAEIRICGAIARGYMADNILSPAYRLPTLAYENSFPEILTYKEVAPNDRDLLIRYYNNVDALNRCLDHCNEAMVEGRKNPALGNWLKREVARAKLKADKIRVDGGSQYFAAISVLAKHLPQESLGPIALETQEPGD